MSVLPDLEGSATRPGALGTPEELLRMAGVVSKLLGIDLRPFKYAIIQHRLSSRVRELGLPSLGAYLDLLDQPDAERERDALISAVTTNVTHFFRESHHFDLLESRILPELLDYAHAGNRVRIWSAGCSSGQEAFSIAACILGVCPEAPRLDVRILATDVDADILQEARTATYEDEAIRQLSMDRRAALFADPRAGKPARVRPEVAELVSFKRLNLVDPWPMQHPLDVIFCRNVAIYLHSSVRERLWQRFAASLRDGGWLFVGHSERVLGPALAQLDHAGVTTYRKRSDPQPVRQSGS